MATTTTYLPTPVSSTFTVSPAKRTETTHRTDLQGLRAVAIILVVLYHANRPWMPGGRIGVDIFFVLSGFFIGESLLRAHEKSNFSFTEFYTRRFARLAPAAVLVILVTLAAVAVLAPEQFYVGLPHAAGALGWFENIQLSLALYHPTAQNTAAVLTPLSHFWSLAAEEQFYFIIPALIATTAGVGAWLVKKRLPNMTRPLVFTASVLIVFFAAAWSFNEAVREPAATYFNPAARGWELAVGVALAAASPLWTKIPANIYTAMLPLVALVGLGWAGWTYTDDMPLPGWPLLLVLGATVLLVMFGNHPSPVRTLLHTSPAQLVGNISYSLYLWHWPALALLIYLCPARSETLTLAVIFGAGVLSYVTWRWVEMPGKISALTHPPVALLASVTVVFCAGVLWLTF